MTSVDSGLRADHLTEAVPEMIAQVKSLTGRQILAEAERAADVIACGADILWAQKVTRNAEVKPDQVRHALAGGLAILATRAGGVTFGGLHWCTDGHPRGEDCPGPGKWTLPERSMNRSARGAFFTPRSLAEEVTDGGLEGIVYEPGPIDTGDKTLWKVLPAVKLLQLKVGDIAVGSGVFLLAACRYLADRLVEAWFAEADHPLPDLPPYNPMTLAARRLVMRCLYGADIDPTSVELARVSLALLSPSAPVDLSKQILCGDSLLGITSLEQLAAMHLDPAKGRELLGLYPPMDPELIRLLGQVEAHVARERV
jgi:hypothetical protein